MALARSAPLAPHFAAWELGADDPTASAGVVANLYATAAGLERARAVLGVPLRVTSGYRSAAHNATVGGSPTSDHVTGLAADVDPVGISLGEAYRRLQAGAASLGAFDQVIFYPADGHIHFGYGSRMRREWRIKVGETGFPELTSALAARLPGAIADVATTAAAAAGDALTQAIDAAGKHPGTTAVVVLALVSLAALVATA